ncbi:Coenzyme F420 hydrogenase/dehydrogenase, beta subunit C-terminal domain [Psychrilyobacter sp.]|uniref:Coenzyme F420 hydrogenase/dehydrogenase, beta subunit C-terminal domain n=1 Tax=Psychrilyobacter sp. TaxID=2586924 RepID=UPI003019A90C
MIDEIIKKEECCGCDACYNICPTDCILMKNDQEGFWYPSVNNVECIECNACVEVCPALKKASIETALDIPEIVAAYSTNEKNRVESTSGGMFIEVATSIINEGGVVFGARYNEQHLVEHYYASTLEGLEALKQSKYLQSKIGESFREVKKYLLEGKKVLFAGTPCHIAGLKNYLNKDYKNLYLIDFLCRGVISPKAYEQFLKSMENKYNSKIKRVWFKNKTYGWHRFSTKIIFENGKEYIEDRYTDVYMRGYLEGPLFLRPSCHECKYKTLPRYSDVSLGDFWGIEKIKKHLDQDKGTSIFMVNSEKGRELLEKISKNLIYEKTSVKDIYLGNSALTISAPLTEKRGEFFKRYLEEDFSDLVTELLKPSLSKRIKKTLRKFRILRFIKKLLKMVYHFLVH